MTAFRTPFPVTQAAMTPTALHVPCDDLDAAIRDYTGTGEYRLDMIMPADAPRIALLSGPKGAVRLELARPPVALPAYDAGMVHIIRAGADTDWAVGRAGMHYRDLLPSRAGGRFIASHIRIPDGGPVGDYVHFHQVGFQLIYCRRGWVRVVYEDQGPPFVMHAGDCVLQPPTIRHRVLEASPGLEVIEVASPAEHPTFRDHVLVLPTAEFNPDRDFGGQRFIRHVAASASWQATPQPGLDVRETAIAAASQGRVGVRVVRATDAVTAVQWDSEGSALRLLHVLAGGVELDSPNTGTVRLQEGDTGVWPAHDHCRLSAGAGGEWLEIVAR